MADPMTPETARLLADPTRARLFRYVLDAPEPVTIAELTAEVGLNHNAVRQHLAKLREGGLVVEDVERRGRPGRPRLRYRPGPEAAGLGDGPTPAERLALLLLEMLRSGRAAREVGRDAGRREVVRTRGGGGLEILEEFAMREGFRPERHEIEGIVELVLGRCPFERAARDDPSTVCQLHRGLAEGLAQAAGGVRVTDLVVHDPREAGCRLRIESDGNGDDAAPPRDRAGRAGRAG